MPHNLPYSWQSEEVPQTANYREGFNARLALIARR